MGYLPAHELGKSIDDFIAKIEKDPVYNKDQCTAIYGAVIKELAPMLISNMFINESVFNEDVKTVLSDCDFPLKPTASEGHRVHEGGRLEDLRELIQYAREQNLMIRTYNQFTGTIESEKPIDHYLEP